MPWPGAGAGDDDAAVVHLDQPPRQRQSDAQSAGGPLENRLRLLEHVEDARQHVRGDADAGVAGCAPPPRWTVDSAVNQICPPRGVNFTALLSTFAKICTSRAPSPSTQIGVAGIRTSSC